jgi:hypothetical protein
MLAQLSSLKSRLRIDATDFQYDDLLTACLEAVSTRFDRECNRTLARTENAAYEFDASDLEICPPIYPIESVSKFELKENEPTGWVEQTSIDYLIRRSCVISLNQAINYQPSTINSAPQARITYTGGYVLPGDTPSPGQVPLPSDLESAATEQSAAWFQNRDRIGLETQWLFHGGYYKISQLDLLPTVRAILRKYQRQTI